MLIDKMPMACKKQDLQKAFNKVPEKLFRNTINAIMAKNREVSLEEVKYKKFVRENEVRLFMEKLGFEVRENKTAQA